MYMHGGGRGCRKWWGVLLGLFWALQVIAQTNPVRVFSVLTYNVKGNGVTNWTTNSLQVQAIGRQMAFLKPDIITFQEIPQKYAYEMTNFVRMYLPGYTVVYNSGTDGNIKSAIASRYPILRSTSWLARAGLTNFGVSNVFTRDLFEAEIFIPGFPTPVHVFTVHLKSGSTTADKERRAAEAAAISNFLVTAFLTSNFPRPYLLTGDLNETNTNSPVFKALINSATGLFLTTPTEPTTLSPLTFSIQATSLTARYDYILPCGILYSNIASGYVFRTDTLTDRPMGLLASDSATASDHLPVTVAFANPFDIPFHLVSIQVQQGFAHIQWEAAPSRLYSVEWSKDLSSWQPVMTNIKPGSTTAVATVQIPFPLGFLRVYRHPQ